MLEILDEDLLFPRSLETFGVVTCREELSKLPASGRKNNNREKMNRRKNGRDEVIEIWHIIYGRCDAAVSLVSLGQKGLAEKKSISRSQNYGEALIWFHTVSCYSRLE